MLGGRKTVLIELATIAEDVFRNIAQVDVKLTWVVGKLFVGEGIHQPKLDVFDIGGFKVDGFHFAHDAAPTALRVFQCTVFVDTSGISCRFDVVVVRATLLGIVGQVEH